MEKMIRKQFTKELESIKKRILALGALVEERVQMAIKAIDTNDSDLAEKIIRSDYEIDEIEVEVEEECLKVLALHQPVAIDLRFIVAVIKINAELERIGDYAKGIAKISLMIGKQPLLKPLIDVPKMADKARRMLTSAVEAFVQRAGETLDPARAGDYFLSDRQAKAILEMRLSRLTGRK